MHDSPASSASATAACPSALFAYVARSLATTIREVGASDPDAWVTLGVVDPFVEPVSADELVAQVPEAQRADVATALADLAVEPAEVRLAITWTPRAGGEAWVLLAVYTTEADVPEHPAAWTWIAPEVRAVPFPSLRCAVGLEPLCAPTLARWALATGDVQTWGAAMFVIEAVAGLEHDLRGPVAELLAQLDGRGLSWFVGEQIPGSFDAEHRAAVGVALALRVALAEWVAECVEGPVEVSQVVGPTSAASPAREVAKRSGGWRRPMAVRQLAAAA